MDETKKLVEEKGMIEKLDFATRPPPNNSMNQDKFPKSVGFIIGNEFCER